VSRLEIASRRRDDGALEAIWLVEVDGGLGLIDAPAAPPAPLPVGAVDAIFRRYGKPLDEKVSLPALAGDDQAVLVTLADGRQASLRAFAFKGWGDVLPSDYLVLEVPGDDALVVAAQMASGALRALARGSAAS
jgi:hypothetical protein